MSDVDVNVDVNERHESRGVEPHGMPAKRNPRSEDVV